MIRKNILTFLLAALFFEFCFSSSAMAVPPGSVKVPASKIFKNGTVVCAKIKRAWIPGTLLRGSWFLSHSANISNLKKSLKGKSAKAKKALQRKIAAFQTRDRIEKKICAKGPLLTPTATATFTATPVPTQTATNTPTPTATRDVLGDALNTVSQTELTNNLYYLASDVLGPRTPGSQGQTDAQDFIEGKFTGAGLQAGLGSDYFQPVAYTTPGAKNVIGKFSGQDASLQSEVIVVGAHLDTVSGTHGADDNASGTVAMLEVARALSTAKSELRRTVVFAAFDLEEEGLYGSANYVSNPVSALISNTVYMVNLDMVGYLASEGHIVTYGASSSPSAKTLMGQIFAKYPSTGTPEYLTDECNSDQCSFSLASVPRVFLHSGDTYSPWHTSGDTADKIDYAGITDIAKIALELVWRIDQADSPPDKSAPLRRGLQRPLVMFDHGVFPFEGR